METSTLIHNTESLRSERHQLHRNLKETNKNIFSYFKGLYSAIIEQQWQYSLTILLFGLRALFGIRKICPWQGWPHVPP